MKYRSEIDGLRSLAVLPVIFFHADFDLFSGGFVGVDIFFVISGYLITTILIEDVDNKRFSIIDFYERRARRILPVLFFVMLACIPFAWLWMLPNQMKDFSQSLTAVSLFFSNILFWSESGYFGAAAEEKPLLHTWSLAVEEQYYLVFPLFLLFIWRFGRVKVFWVVFAVAAVSLMFSEWGWRNKASANFYLAPTRVWELLAGSMASIIVYERGVKKNDLISILGLVAIVFPIFFYDASIPVPSLYAVIPVLGVVLLILYADQKTLVAKILSTGPLVGIGLISYSAYLWHQPLFAFARIKMSGHPPAVYMGVLSVVSIGLAYVSWRLIEKPTRNKVNFRRGKVLVMSVIGIAFFSVVGWWGHETDGYEISMLKYKYSEQEGLEARAVITSVKYDMYREMVQGDCMLWAKNPDQISDKDIEKCSDIYGEAIVVLGDSHAMNLYNIVSLSDAYPFVIGLSQGYCRPHDNKPFCHYDDFESFVEKNKNVIKSIVFHQSGSYFIKDVDGNVDSQSAFLGDFSGFDDDSIIKVSNYLSDLVIHHDIDVVWIGPFLEYRRKPEKMLFKEGLKSVNPISVALFEKLDLNIRSILSGQQLFSYKSYREIFYEPVKAFEGDCFLFRDVDHYSRCGEKVIADRLEYRSLVSALN